MRIGWGILPAASQARHVLVDLPHIEAAWWAVSSRGGDDTSWTSGWLTSMIAFLSEDYLATPTSHGLAESQGTTEPRWHGSISLLFTYSAPVKVDGEICKSKPDSSGLPNGELYRLSGFYGHMAYPRAREKSVGYRPRVSAFCWSKGVYTISPISTPPYAILNNSQLTTPMAYHAKRLGRAPT